MGYIRNQQPYKGTYYPQEFLHDLAQRETITWNECVALSHELKTVPDPLGNGWFSDRQRMARAVLGKAKALGVRYIKKPR